MGIEQNRFRLRIEADEPQGEGPLQGHGHLHAAGLFLKAEEAGLNQALAPGIAANCPGKLRAQGRQHAVRLGPGRRGFRFPAGRLFPGSFLLLHPAEGAEQRVPDDVPAPGGEQGQAAAEGLQGRPGQLRPQAFRENGADGGGDGVPGPGQLRDLVADGLPGLVQQLLGHGHVLGIRGGIPADHFLQARGQGFVIVVGGMGQNIAFRPQGGKQDALLRQMGAFQQMDGALPGDGAAPEGMEHLLVNFAGGGLEGFLAAEGGAEGIPGQAAFKEGGDPVQILLPDGQALQAADDAQPLAQVRILRLQPGRLDDLLMPVGQEIQEPLAAGGFHPGPQAGKLLREDLAVRLGEIDAGIPEDRGLV